jgi:hypothetical protein
VASLAAVSLAGACTAAQSARVLEPGKTQLTVSGARSTETDSDEDVLWHGTVMLRRGLAPKLDGGVLLDRTPGSEGLSLATVDGKVQLTPPGRGTVSFAVALGPFWADGSGGDGLDGEYGGMLLMPTIFLGYQLAPTAELVLAPRIYAFFPDEDDQETKLGGAMGVRFTDPARTWAVHPELAYLRFDEETFLTLGVSISAGN